MRRFHPHLSYFRMQLIKGLQYRTAAWAGIFPQFFWGFMQIQLYRALYIAHESTFPMAFSGLVSYIWLRQAFLALLNTWSYEYELFDMILSGNVALELCRPVGLYGMFIAVFVPPAFEKKSVAAAVLAAMALSTGAAYAPGLKMIISKAPMSSGNRLK